MEKKFLERLSEKNYQNSKNSKIQKDLKYSLIKIQRKILRPFYNSRKYFSD